MADPVDKIHATIRRKTGSRHYCFGTIPSDRIKHLTFVPVIQLSRKTYLMEIEEQGYQRPGSPARMRGFMKYLIDYPNSVVPPVLLSARENWRFFPSPSDPGIGTLEVFGAAAIVDGQHRLGGYVALYDKHEETRDVSFILLMDLDVEEEKNEFIHVNNSQKGVPRPLTAFLEGSEEAQIAWALNEDPDSPFYKRISRAQMERQHLFALHSVARQIKELFKLGALTDLEPDAKIEYTERFFQIVADVLQEEWSDIERLDDPEAKGRRDFQYRLLELTGLIAWCTVGAVILQRSHSPDAGMNWENVERLIKAAAGADWSKDGQYAGRTGSAGARVIAQDMLRLLPAETTSAGEEE